jgi:hypothetical protein
MSSDVKMTVLVATVIVAAGCFRVTPHNPLVRPSASIAVANPAEAVFSHCRELVCTQADVPSCDFEQASRGVEPGVLVERIHCRRSAFGTDCEERRAPGGPDDLSGEPKVLKFRCSGDPVQCWTVGGNASWATALDPANAGGTSLQFPCAVHRAGPAPAQHPVPGPDTV